MTGVQTCALPISFMLVGAWIGGRLFGLATPATFRYVALVILATAGLFGLLR